EWTPVQFTYPSFEPCPDQLKDVKPIPYRPFRWGQYHVTMGIRNMLWDDWIELDQLLPKYHRIKAHRIATRGEKAVQTLPPRPGAVDGGHAAAKELVYELSEYLSRRYPSDFRVTRHPLGKGEGYGWYGLGQIKDITIVPISVTYDLDTEDPMTVSAMLIQDDLALMVEGSDGRYYFQAGAICVPGFWRMSDKIGMPLEEIHTSGNVPQYQEKLHVSLARFFKRLPVDKPVIRNNYFVQIVQPNPSPADIDPEELAWSNTTNGDEDAFEHGTHGPEQQTVNTTFVRSPDDPGSEPAYTVHPSTLRMRTERQTLRRLPRSGAVVFTIRTYLFPVEEIAKEKGAPGRMASAVRSWPEDVAKYKGQKRYKDILLDYLDECHKKQ
ncbi:hypothetical protein JAAARDRAFT_111140, partial [Jaapia argillacea MUCL 33604]